MGFVKCGDLLGFNQIMNRLGLDLLNVGGRADGVTVLDKLDKGFDEAKWL